MATPVVFNGVNYSVPGFGDVGYAQGPGNLSAYLIALATGTLQPTGGLFSLTSELDFGPNFGIKSVYYKTQGTPIAQTGVFRMARTDFIAWRDQANANDLELGVNASDQLTYNGIPISTSSGTILLPDGSAAAPSLTFLLDTDTGLYRVGNNILGFATNGLLQWVINSTGALIGQQTGGVIRLEPGSAAIPAYSFSADTNTGIFNFANDDMVFVTNATTAFRLNPSQQGLFADGTAALPSISFNSNPNTGFYRGGSNTVVVSVGGTATTQFDSTQFFTNVPIRAADGSAGLPGISFLTDNDTGLFHLVSNRIDVSLGGTNYYLFQTTGLNINTTAPNAILAQASAPGAIYGFFIDNQSNTASSDARIATRVAGTSAGDPHAVFSVISGQSWAIGADNSDSDRFKVCATSDLSSSEMLTIDAATTAVSIHGTNTNNNAAAGFVGEAVRNVTTVAANLTTSNVYQDALTISLTAGDWDVTGQVKVDGNSGTWTGYAMAVSLFSGNTVTDHATGDNAWTQSTAGTYNTGESFCLTISAYRISLTSTTTVYLKARATFTVGNPRFVAGRISARRVR